MTVSFYSYKGGVGRSQLAANVASYLCTQKGKRVLLWDWDFEAPGLHYFFGLKNENITKKGTLELLEEYMVTMRKNENVQSTDLKFITQSEHIISQVNAPQISNKKGCIDLMAAGNYNEEFNWRVNNFDWFEFYSMKDGANYLELVKENLKTLNYDYILIDSRTGISDYSGICNIQLPDINVIVVAPTLQNFEGSKSIIEKIRNAEYLKIKNRKPRILPILSRLDYSNPRFNEWVDRFTAYFSEITRNLDDEFDVEFLPEMFTDVYFKDTFLPYTPAISAGENVLFTHKSRHSRIDYSRPFQNIAEMLENINNNSLSFYKKVDEDTWQEYAEKAKIDNQKKKLAIAYTQIGIKQNNYDSQIKYYKQAIDADPDYYLPYSLAGSSFNIIGKAENAIEYLQNAIERKDDDYSSYHALGQAYNFKGDYNKAIENYLKTIELNPNSSDVYSSLGDAYNNKEDIDKAIESYQRAIVLNPENADAYKKLAKAYDKKGESDKALKFYLKISELDKDSYGAFLKLGNAYNERGEIDKAVECYQKAIELNPENADAYKKLAIAYDKKGEIDKVLEFYLKVAELDNTSFDTFFKLGNAYIKKGQIDKAVEWYQKAIELNPENADAYKKLAIAYNEKGETDKASKFYQSYLKFADLDKASSDKLANLDKASSDNLANLRTIENNSQAIRRPQIR